MGFVLRRLAGLLPTMLAVVTVVFLLIHAVPGDPVAAILGDRAAPDDVAAMRAALGLDRPLPEQFVHYLRGVAAGDWGYSLVSGRPVLELIGERMPATGLLAAAALAVALAVGMLAGPWLARRRGVAREVADGAVLALVAVPSFVIGPLLMLVFAVGLGWLPVSGADSLWGLVLPAVTLGLGMGAVLARLLASSLGEVAGRPFVVTAVAKGAARGRVFWRHLWRNALIPAVQIFFLQMGMVLTGAVLTEAVFGWPGVGNLLVEALQGRDYPLLQGCLLMIALVYGVMTLLADVVSAVLDPRVRHD